MKTLIVIDQEPEHILGWILESNWTCQKKLQVTIQPKFGMEEDLMETFSVAVQIGEPKGTSEVLLVVFDEDGLVIGHWMCVEFKIECEQPFSFFRNGLAAPPRISHWFAVVPDMLPLGLNMECMFIVGKGKPQMLKGVVRTTDGKTSLIEKRREYETRIDSGRSSCRILDEPKES